MYLCVDRYTAICMSLAFQQADRTPKTLNPKP